ncbi:MAG: hypothetical protein ACE1ZD_04990, partial [Dehalococcoidia bacterium]
SIEEAYTEDDFFGVTMYWSNHSLDGYKDILTEVRFRILETSVIGHGYSEAHHAPDEQHPLVLAQKE